MAFSTNAQAHSQARRTPCESRRPADIDCSQGTTQLPPRLCGSMRGRPRVSPCVFADRVVCLPAPRSASARRARRP